MKELDDILKMLDGCYVPIHVKGKEYPGNNPYILNKINNLLTGGVIKKEDVVFESPIEWIYGKDGYSDGYIFYPALEQIFSDICKETEEIYYRYQKMKREKI